MPEPKMRFERLVQAAEETARGASKETLKRIEQLGADLTTLAERVKDLEGKTGVSPEEVRDLAGSEIAEALQELGLDAMPGRVGQIEQSLERELPQRIRELAREEIKEFLGDLSYDARLPRRVDDHERRLCDLEGPSGKKSRS